MKKYELRMPKEISYGWYVEVKNDCTLYLRKDLQVLKGTGWDTDNSGYFETYEEANEVRNKYLGIVSEKKLNQSKNINKLHKKIENQKDEIVRLQNALNMANSTVAKQIDEISSLHRILSSKQQYLEKALSDFEKQYESQLKVQDNELKRRLTIIHYLEEKLFNKGE